jgi:quercetin dioxygenase-like cupin family protein
MNEKEKRTDAESLRGTVARLTDLVGYQDSSVVSRQIVSGSAGTVTMFAFDQGEGLSEHTTPFDAMVQVIDGEAQINIAGKPLRVKEGELVIMPANEPHAVKATTRFKMLLTMIRS